MASDPSQFAPPSSLAAKPRVCDKVRLRFRKAGNLRLVSHRDLMKCFERALRRADLPVHVTQGFHPLPRMVFALSLGLGIIGLQEVLELEFDAVVDVDDVQARLARQMPAGLDILTARRIAVHASARVRRAGYRVEVPAERCGELAGRLAGLLAAPQYWIERSRPQPRRFDLRPFLSELPLKDRLLQLILWVTPTGTARPAEVLEALGLGDLVLAGVPLERFFLELFDEIHDPGPVLEIPPVPAAEDATAVHDGAPVRAARPSHPTPLVSGPMNFDS
jgi:radical SAM-linked protein